jgi:hypothetical protein
MTAPPPEVIREIDAVPGLTVCAPVTLQRYLPHSSGTTARPASTLAAETAQWKERSGRHL